MRPLPHPKLDEITVEGILHALSDPIRMEIFGRLAASECAKNCSAFAHLNADILPKSTLSQHFRILREAGLIRSERKGVELINSTRCGELKERFGPMLEAIRNAYARQREVKGFLSQSG
ncbi:ArsR/SmtB family transcription factor [Methylocystis bryophila]|uniref:Transcriptional regulator n=1 Tax=Methylocystis bryophila TaxID=655015 RepID=A0A1W6MWB6_9HYPH|nr:helix-turn-helix domain-containing protein [Methylocystis bryophila]ARN81881.1 transcriptional regulator [Methylocystis bryophila]BDV37960.1 transcriptional regulator [Methylocystis bryophila]